MRPSSPRLSDDETAVLTWEGTGGEDELISDPLLQRCLIRSLIFLTLLFKSLEADSRTAHLTALLNLIYTQHYSIVLVSRHPMEHS